MNLQPLFETQKKLMDRIGYNEPDRFEKTILALLVEVGECANEWRGFKYWSKNPKPRTNVKVLDNGSPNKWVDENPLLEEYVDGLHFVLQLGLEDEEYDLFYGAELKLNVGVFKEGTVTDQFIKISTSISTLSYDQCQDFYDDLLYAYIGLGELLGFTWGQIEQAYMDKNAENHRRQETGY